MKSQDSHPQNDSQRKRSGEPDQGAASRQRQAAEAAVAGEERKPQNASSSNVETEGTQPLKDERPDPTVEQNPVDEAGWESFPASDPPAVSRSAAKRPK